MSQKAGVLIMLWMVGVAASIAMSPFSQLFAGIAIGSVVTVILLGFVIRLSVKSLVNNTMTDVESMQNSLEDNLERHNQENRGK